MLSIAFMPYHAIPPARRLLSPTDYPNLYPTGRLSLVARSSSGHRQFTDKYPHNLPTRSHASSCSDRWRRKYHFKQDTFRYHHPPKPGAIMDLSTGIITSEVSYDKAADMGINDFTVQYIMLPVKSSSPMTLTLELMVNGESFHAPTPLRSLHPTTSCQPEIHTFSGQLSMKTPSHSPMSV